VVIIFYRNLLYIHMYLCLSGLGIFLVGGRGWQTDSYIELYILNTNINRPQLLVANKATANAIFSLEMATSVFPSFFALSWLFEHVSWCCCHCTGLCSAWWMSVFCVHRSGQCMGDVSFFATIIFKLGLPGSFSFHTFNYLIVSKIVYLKWKDET
jgi:hypothetical protein